MIKKLYSKMLTAFAVSLMAFMFVSFAPVAYGADCENDAFVTIGSPITGDILSGQNTISGDITVPQFPNNPNFNVTQIQYSLDGFGVLGTQDDDFVVVKPSQHSYSFIWDTTQFANGSYTLRVTAIGTQCALTNVTKTVSIVINNPLVQQYSCAGFESPFDNAISLKRKVQRAIPLKAQIYLAGNSSSIVTLDILNALGAAPPVVNVIYNPVVGPAEDVTDDLLPKGASSSGNTFSYDAATQSWTYNIDSSRFTAAGTYVVKMLSGDPLYNIAPTCEGTFVRQ